MADAAERLVEDSARAAQEATARQTALDKLRDETASAETKELAPLEAQAATIQAQPVAPPVRTPLPEYKPAPVVDAKDYQKFSFGILGMALIGGAVSRGNWLGVSASLNGALKGYLEGNEERAAKEFQDYQAKFKAAQAHDEQAQREFENILRSKTLSINSMLSQIKITAAKYGREDVRQAAEQKSIDGIWKQVEATDRALAQLGEYHERTSVQLSLGKQRLAAIGGAELTPKGRALMEGTMELGDPTLSKMGQSRFGRTMAVQEINDMAARGVTPEDVVMGRVNLDTLKATLRQTEQRTAGVERLTGAISRMEQNVLDIAQGLGLSQARALNATVNELRKQMNDEQFAKFRTEILAISRQYIEAVTMPGSNAQLHASSQEMADSILSTNMSVSAILGVFAGMNDEIKAGREALGDTSQRLRDAISHHGLKLKSAVGQPVGDSWPTAPPSVEDLLKKYGDGSG